MYYQVPYIQPRTHPYQKLGGLLKFFVAMVPIGLFFTVASQFSPTAFWHAWPVYAAGEFWLQLVTQLCGLYATAMNIVWAVMLLLRDPRFARTWQLGYLGSLVSTAARWPLHMIYGYPEGTSLATDIFITLLIPAGFALWTLYFARSARVRTYMGTDRYLRLAFFTRSVRGPRPLVPDGA